MQFQNYILQFLPTIEWIMNGDFNMVEWDKEKIGTKPDTKALQYLIA